jgi:hypothetical protein
MDAGPEQYQDSGLRNSFASDTSPFGSRGNLSRRQFFGRLGLLGTGLLMTTNGFAQTNPIDPEAYEPVGAIHYLGDSFLWVGSVFKNGENKYALFRKRRDARPEVFAELGGPNLCRFGGVARLYALGPNAKTSIEITATPDVRVQSLQDFGRACEECKFAKAKKMATLERSGFSGLTCLGFGSSPVDNPKYFDDLNALACRPAANDHSSELLLFVRGDKGPQTAHVEWPLARDNPVIYFDATSGHWLVYPSLSFERRNELKNSLEGIPVARISNTLEIILAWVPWAEWNDSSVYSLYPFGAALVGASLHEWSPRGQQLSGIYMSSDSRWERRFGGQVETSSLAASSDAAELAWIQQIKTDSSLLQFGRFKSIVRVEHI